MRSGGKVRNTSCPGLTASPRGTCGADFLPARIGEDRHVLALVDDRPDLGGKQVDRVAVGSRATRTSSGRIESLAICAWSIPFG